MALKLDKAMFRVLAEGRAEPAIKRFIDATFAEHVAGVANSPEDDDALIAAIALMAMMRTAGGRKAIGLPERRRGKEFDIRDYLDDERVWEIGVAVDEGKLDRRAARTALEKFVGIRDERTIDRLLSDLQTIVADMSRLSPEQLGDAIDFLEDSEDLLGDDLGGRPHTQPR